MVVRLKRPRGYRNPGGFDRERYLIAAGIDAVGYVREVQSIQLLNTDKWSVDLFRSRISDFIAAGVKPTEKAALLQALLVGDTRNISSQQWELYKNTGTVHLLVISGLHIGLVAGGSYLLLMSAGRLFPGLSLRKRTRFVVVLALLLSFAYSLLAGFSLPTQRAWVMVCALMMSTVWGRQSSPLSRLRLAAAVVLTLDPLAAVSPGFWLSFGAAGVLLYIVCGRLGSGAYLKSKFASMIKIQLAVSLVLIPLLAFHFYRIPLGSSVINLLAVPFVSLLVLPLAMLSLLLSQMFAELGSQGLNAAGWLLLEGSFCLQIVADWVVTVWTPETVSPLAIGFALLGCGILLMPRAIPGRSLGVVFWLPMLTGYEQPLESPAFNVTVLDVGQGLSIHVETATHHLLYDTGPKFRSGFSAAQAAISPYLLNSGVRHLDKLIVSHGDNDHAGGIDYFRDNWEINQLITGSAKLDGTYSKCSVGQRWVWDGVIFTMLHPDSRAEAGADQLSENNRSCVLKIQSEFGSILLTGDIERETELRLSERYRYQLQADVLVVPHHGSQTSSQSEFIKNVQPNVAIVSSGFLNRFGHPHPKVVNRYRLQKSILINTADSGAIRLSFRSEYKKEPIISRYRYQNQRYWWD
ncbi:DNA internalization-related competence protein ComEC/Rec2 [Motiliproteus sp. MSK22-1]|nr:DNA internalization-related competence protein ComEC/Rec2 [Motiliproteus sp. MSK22-1]